MKCKIALVICLLTLGSVIIERTTLPETTEHMTVQAVQYGKDNGKTAPPKQFVYDGCTFFVDSLLGSDFNQVCLAHDIAYWYGGNEEEKKLADKILSDGMKREGIAGMFVHFPAYIAVHLFGDSVLTRSVNAHWGFGWE